MPFVLDTAVELSPPGWTREASAPPAPAQSLPPSSGVYALDEPAPSRFVLFILDSAEEVTYDAGDRHDVDGGHDYGPGLFDHRIDWDSVLWAALAELGLHAPGMPDWFWNRTGTP
ncbi:hypothetical protein AB0H43_13650 [Hamadaea sp. NPDC050747]|uniref:hypothetical protein n=1 Tax=Hamadaea sp. NPDC050747 TaxID=3155789 RepID=UPI0033E49441